MRTIGYSTYQFRPMGTYSNTTKTMYIGSSNNKPVVKSSR
jgi:hypothetical protein